MRTMHNSPKPMLRNCLPVLIILIAMAVTGCGKSKQQLAAEAEQLRLKAEAAAVAASQAEAKAAGEMQAAASAKQIADLQAKVVSQLKDPASAQFRAVQLNAAGTAACGQVNAKNSFGGYVGFQDFIASADEVLLAPAGCGSTPVFQMSPENGAACMKYLMAKLEQRRCE
jgi:hypothetical protein